MMIPPAEITSANYVSSFCSRYYPWFVDLGYPRLDVIEFADGEWGIIQMESMPIVPSLTKWRMVLQGIRHVEVSYGFIKKYIEQIDIQRKAFWDREEAKSRAAHEEAEKAENAAIERAEKAYGAIRQNPALMERIARNGMQEMDLRRIARHVPKSELKRTAP